MGGGGIGEGGCIPFVIARSRMTIDPRIPTMPGTEHVGFSPIRKAFLAPSAERRGGGWGGMAAPDSPPVSRGCFERGMCFFCYCGGY